MNLLVTPTMWGPISDEQVRELADEKHAIFSCGKCSDGEAAVFHNLLGVHAHRPASELLPLIPDADK